MMLAVAGWVKTDMGSERAPLTVEQSTTGILQVLETAAEVQMKGTSSSHPDHAAFASKLKENQFVFVQYDGGLMPY
jgi:hypothetical protein